MAITQKCQGWQDTWLPSFSLLEGSGQTLSCEALRIYGLRQWGRDPISKCRCISDQESNPWYFNQY